MSSRRATTLNTGRPSSVSSVRPRRMSSRTASYSAPGCTCPCGCRPATLSHTPALRVSIASHQACVRGQFLDHGGVGAVGALAGEMLPEEVLHAVGLVEDDRQ